MITSFTSTSPDATRDLGAALAGALAPGDLIGLEGELGAGKTVLTQGIAAGLDCNEPATSPSFVLVHIYPGRLRLVHVDLYRLNSAQAEELALEDYLIDAVGVVEWAERLGGLRPDLRIKLTLLPGEPQARQLEFQPLSARGAELLAAVRAQRS